MLIMDFLFSDLFFASVLFLLILPLLELSPNVAVLLIYPFLKLLICQAARLLANLLVIGGTVLGRAAVQAYRQAIVSEYPISSSHELFLLNLNLAAGTP